MRTQPDIRALDAETWPAARDTMMTAFGDDESPEEARRWDTVAEFPRMFAAYEGDLPIGTAGAFSFTMSVPGGRCRAAGVTMVSVLPTHRRRGVLTRMMRHQLGDIRERGEEPLAILVASEPGIYGRFGYGIGAYEQHMRIPRDPRALRVPPGIDEVTLRFADLESALPAVENVYARCVNERPGLVERDERWARFLNANDTWNHGGASVRCVLAERAGEVVGYARYHRTSEPRPGEPGGIVKVRDVFAVDPAAYAAVWRFLLDMDLTVTALVRRPVDDPLTYLLTNPRRAVPRVADASHVRLVDVGRALAARTYRVPIDLVFEVDDTFCEWNAGRWRLSGDDRGATCERTTDTADIALGVRELASAYLGAVSPHVMAGSGEIDERRPGALDEFARAFSVPRAPFLAFDF
jgi:predicted acetyltransferase